MKTLRIFFIFLCVQGLNAQSEKVTHQLEKFTEVKGFDGLSINLIKSNENKAVITGVNTRKVAIVNNDGKLKLRMEIDKMFSGYRTFIDLHFTEELKLIDVNEDARIASDEIFEQDILDVRAQEGGELVLQCETEQLLVKSVTGGKITVNGFSDNQDVIINTGGVYNGETFKTKFTTVSVNAGGNAEIYATDYVKANVKAGGEVLVYGDPQKMDERKVFGGKIKRVGQ